ncbi:core-2/I-branching beta-1,6-N-acetylglucosaminyltransferase family protein [Actinidia rufa]|uniref:Core-2/I-branching beta-1,6-N-acetylglucosaminyltransferase family protein n=1 Tax=Actinidia rufa TaxID=165716 RepID=A0A7J0H448_9ERIC|nr:core-2/I-branching beta-1,6-N-acetylglucosaminyltransferase family protein [Actinidia rufa]
MLTFSSSSSPLVPTLVLLFSLPLLFLLAPRILPPRPVPISLPDELDDLSLFRRASADSPPHRPLPSAKSRLGSTNPKPKIAFLFLTNSDLHFASLWEQFFSNGSKSIDRYNIYIHADPTVKINPPGGVFTDRFIPAKRTRRSSATLIAAARRLLATALLDDPRNAFFALLSQHCIPLHSFDFVYNTLFHRSIAELAQFGSLQYRSFIEILSTESILWNRYNARGKNVMLPEVPFEQFRVGSQFFILTRRHAVAVVRDRRRLWRKFKLPCISVNSCYPEEHYFPTLLSMEDSEGCTHYTLTRVNWTDSIDGHPHTYRPPELSPELIYKLRQSNFTHPYLFARKFSPDCLTPLLNISESVIFRD